MSMLDRTIYCHHYVYILVIELLIYSSKNSIWRAPFAGPTSVFLGERDRTPYINKILLFDDR